MMVWNGRLPGATSSGCAGSSEKPWPRFCRQTPQLGHDDARAEAHVVALDEADHHAALVGGAEVDRAALGRVAGAEVLRPLRVDQLRALGEVGVVEHLLGRAAHASRGSATCA